MATFNYRAKDKKGQELEGTLSAPSQEAALGVLEENSLIPIEIFEVRKRSLLDLELEFLNRVKARDIVTFSRQFAVMMSANLPIVKSLRVLVQQSKSPILKKAILQIADEVDGGARLSQALSRFPKIFSNFYVAMVRSGETAGRLDEVLNYLADQMEKDYDLMTKIRGAMIYPAFVIVAMSGVGLVMMTFVVPKLTSILLESGQQLPLATRALIKVSSFLSSYWWLLLLIIFGLIVLYPLTKRTPEGKLLIDRFKIKVPFIGKLFQRIYLVRLTRSLGTLLVGGVPLTQALRVSAEVVGNFIYQDLIIKTIKGVEDGNPLTSVFAKSKEVPVMFTQMVNIGEQTGQLNKILEKLTDFYTREIDNLVTNLISLVEPLIMILLGLGVGVMVAAIIMPMYNLAGAF